LQPYTATKPMPNRSMIAHVPQTNNAAHVARAVSVGEAGQCRSWLHGRGPSPAGSARVRTSSMSPKNLERFRALGLRSGRTDHPAEVADQLARSAERAADSTAKDQSCRSRPRAPCIVFGTTSKANPVNTSGCQSSPLRRQIEFQARTAGTPAAPSA
jgi:hypothetical protein